MRDFLKRVAFISAVLLLVIVATVLVSLTPDSHAATATPQYSPAECYHAIKDSKADAAMKSQCRSVFKNENAYQPCTVKLPIKKTGCLGELCESHVGCRVSEDVVMHAEPSEKAPSAGALRAGTLIKSRELVSLVTSVGKAVQSQTLDVDEEKVEKLRFTDVISYVSDGNFEFCRGKDVFMSPDEEFTVALEPEVEEWAKVKLKSGKTGWVPTKFLSTTDGGACGALSAN